MKGFKKSLKGILPCLFEISVGILLLINPVGFTKGIITALGIALLILSIISIIKYFRTEVDAATDGQFLLKGLLCLVFGGFCIINSEWFIKTFPALTIIYGIALLVIGLSKIQLSVDLLRRDNKKWYLASISALFSIICSIVIFKNPFATTEFIWTFTGICLIIESILDIITLIISNKERPEEKEEIEEEKNNKRNEEKNEE